MLITQKSRQMVGGTYLDIVKNQRKRKEEIKYRLSDIGAAIGNIALTYIAELEEENKTAKEIIRRFYRHIFLREGFMEINDFNVWKNKAETFMNKE